MRKKCGLDLDGCVYQFIEEFDKYAERLGYKIDKKEYDRGLSKKDVRMLLDDFSESRPFLWIPTYNGVVKNLKRLSDKIDFYIVTHRRWTEKGKEDTLERLAHDSIPYKEVIFSNEKGRIAKEKGFDFFIEDNLDNALDISNQGVLTFLLDRKYNRKPLNGKIVRIKSLKELL